MFRLKTFLLLLLAILVIAAGSSLLVILSSRHQRALDEEMAAAVALHESGEFSAATAAFRELLRKDRDNAEAAFALFDLLVFFDRDEARELLQSIRITKATHASVLYRRVRLALLDGKLEEAEKAVATLESVGSRGLDTVLARLLLLVNKGDFENGLPLLAELRDAHPANRQLAFIASQALSLSPSPLDRIRAKDGYLGLLGQSDQYSFMSAVFLILSRQFSLFPEDRLAVARHLESHPRLEDGLAELDFKVLDALAESLVELRPELAYTITGHLVERPDATDASRILHVYAAQLAGVLGEVQATAEALKNQDNLSDRGSILYARQLALQGNPGLGFEVLKNLHVASPDDGIVFNTLYWLANQHLAAMETGDKISLLKILMEHPLTSPELYLLVCNNLLQLNPDERESILLGAIGKLRDVQMPFLCSWLNGHNEPDRVRELINREQALADQEYFYPLFDALLGIWDKEAALKLLADARDLLEPWQSHLMHARIHLLAAEDPACRAELEEAIENLPPEGRSRLFQIAEVADNIGARELKLKAYDLAHDTGIVFPLGIAMDYLLMLLETRDFKRCLRFSAYLRNLYPDNPYTVNNHSYFKLVAGKPPQDCIGDLTRIVEDHPEIYQFKLSLSVSQLFAGYPGQALETIESIGGLESFDNDRDRATYALVLAGTGDKQAARDILDSVNIASLMDAEIQLLDRYLRDGSVQ